MQFKNILISCLLGIAATAPVNNPSKNSVVNLRFDAYVPQGVGEKAVANREASQPLNNIG